jgi:hypothetical protein
VPNDSSKRRGARQEKRLKRKRQIALQQAENFEDTLSSHELNLERLNALPEALRDSNHDAQVEAEERAIGQLEQAIEATLAAVEELPSEDSDTNGNGGGGGEKPPKP